MLTTIATVLLILWLIGVVALPSLGVAIHVLLVWAIIVILIRIIRGERIL